LLKNFCKNLKLQNKMAILQLKTRVSPTSGSAIMLNASTASTINYYYDTNNIVWPTLAAASGSLINSAFVYDMGPNNGQQRVLVQNAVASIVAFANSSAASAVVVP
jgi:hypothetical protein